MRREQLEHVLRAASRITHDREFLVVGSAAILGTYPDDLLPVLATRSDEADLAPLDDPGGEKSLLLEAHLGQGSQFHDTFGYYADGVGLETAITPDGWQGRLVRLDSTGAEPGVGLCLERHDLAASKLAAGREKDLEFVGALLDVGLLDAPTLAARVESLPPSRVLPGVLAQARRFCAARE